MSIRLQKLLVGFLGILLFVSVVIAGYRDLQIRKKQVLGAAIAPLANPKLEQGRNIYEKFGCIACHGADGKTGIYNFNARTGQQVPPVAFVSDSYTKAELTRKIAKGVPQVQRLNPNGPDPPLYMPAYKDSLTQPEMESLVDYLMSLSPKKSKSEF